MRRRAVKTDHLRASHRTVCATHEQPAERFAKLATHGAVDEEVEEIAEEDAEIDDAGRHRWRTLVEHVQVENVAEDQRHEDDGHRELDEQEDPDDDDQHQRRRIAFGQSAALRPSVVLEKSLSSGLGCAHRVHEGGVEQNEHGARQHVDEHDAEHVVDAEVDVLVTVDERHKAVDARRHVAAVVQPGRNLGIATISSRIIMHVSMRIQKSRRNPDWMLQGHSPIPGRNLDGGESPLGEAERMRHDSGDHDADDGAGGVVDGAEATSGRRPRVTDADVALDGQQHRHPDWRRVENGRQVVDEALVGEAPSGRHPVGVASEHVEVDVARQRPDSRQRCRDWQGDENDVGRTCAHVRFEQNDADDAVGDDGEQHDGRRHVTTDDIHLSVWHDLRKPVDGIKDVKRRRSAVLHRIVGCPCSSIVFWESAALA